MRYEQGNCPFIGMRPYRSEEHPVFFGRERELKKSLAILNGRGSLILFGKSGVGKSSFINAGIVQSYVSKRKSKVVQVNCSDEDTVEALESFIAAHATHNEHPSGSLLVLDQFEGILNMDPDSQKNVFNLVAFIINTSAQNHETRTLISIQTEYFYVLDKLLIRSPRILDNRHHILPIDHSELSETFQKISQTSKKAFLATHEISEILRRLRNEIRNESEDPALDENLLVGFAQLMFREIWLAANSGPDLSQDHAEFMKNADIVRYVDQILDRSLSFHEKTLVHVVTGLLVTSSHFRLSWRIDDLVPRLSLDSFPLFSRARWMQARQLSTTRVKRQLAEVFSRLAKDHQELFVYDSEQGTVRLQHRVILEAVKFWRSSYEHKLANDGAWMAYCDQTAEAKSLDYYFFAVVAPEQTAYSFEYLRILAGEVAKTIGGRPPEIRKKAGTSFNTIVDELLEHRAALGEFGYYSATRAWRSDMVSVGTVKYCACVCNKNNAAWLSGLLNQDFKKLSGDYDLAAKELLGGQTCTIEKAFRQIDHSYPNHPTSLIAQTGTTIEDELEQVAQRVGETLRQRTDDWETPYDLMRDMLGIFLSIQNESIGQSGQKHNHIAFLDWRIACKMAARYAENGDCYFLMLQYSSPLSVGYFYPKGDRKFRSVILKAARESLLIEDGAWKDDVVRDLHRNLIVPNPHGPRIISSI